jgi:hypothetical protein
MVNGIIRTFLWRLIPARVPTGPQAGGSGEKVFVWKEVKRVGKIPDDRRVQPAGLTITET